MLSWFKKKSVEIEVVPDSIKPSLEVIRNLANKNYYGYIVYQNVNWASEYIHDEYRAKEGDRITFRSIVNLYLASVKYLEENKDGTN